MKTPKSVFIHTKRWRDKVNGQSYFACRIEVGTANYLFVPFQYGYESADIEAATKVLRENGWNVNRRDFNTSQAPFDHYYASEWTTKREAKRFGEDFSG